MQLQLSYKGDLGEGNTTVHVAASSDFHELLQLFHSHIGKSPTYSIGAGAPPFRRSISVGYEYTIQVNNTRVMDFSLPIGKLLNDMHDIIVIEVSGAGKCD